MPSKPSKPLVICHCTVCGQEGKLWFSTAEKEKHLINIQRQQELDAFIATLVDEGSQLTKRDPLWDSREEFQDEQTPSVSRTLGNAEDIAMERLQTSIDLLLNPTGVYSPPFTCHSISQMP